MTSRCAFLCGESEFNYFLPVINCLSQNSFDVLIKPHLSEACQSVSKSSVTKLRERGYAVYSASNELLKRYEYIVSDINFANHKRSDFDQDILRTRKCLCMSHSVDANSWISQAGHAYILSSKRQALRHAWNKVNIDDHREIFEKAKKLPRHEIMEFAYTGPYHLGEWEQKRHSKKDKLRKELEDYLQQDLPHDRPIVAFLQDEFCHPRQVEKALQKLAKQVTLIVKPLKLDAIPKEAILWPSKEMAPHLLRFSADYILAGYHSGTLASSIMLGLRVIPYYTRMIHYGGRFLGKLAKYTEYLPENSKEQTIGTEILSLLNFYVDLEEHRTIIKLIEDSDLWNNYSRNMYYLQHKVFKDYCIDGATQKTASLIERNIEFGSFQHDVSAIYLKKEFGRINERICAQESDNE